MEGCDPASPDSPVLSEVDSNSDRGFSPDVANQNPRDVIEKMSKKIFSEDLRM